MKRELRTIYEYLDNYSAQEIDNIIAGLSDEEKLLIIDRYGCDLYNPQTSGNWCRESSDKFYKCLIPKIKRLLNKSRKKIEYIESAEVQEENEVLDSSGDIVIQRTSNLLEMLKNGTTNEEMCKNLGLSLQELYEELLKLRNNGIGYSKNYYSDGSILYKNISTVSAYKKEFGVDKNKVIVTDSEEDSLKLLVISDLHFGNEFERLDLLNRAYDYCIKNGINIILCGGDFVDGAFSQCEQKITDLYKQVEYFIENYPYDKSILTFAVGGDHDLSLLHEASLNIIEICNNFRHDIVIGGYGNAFLNIKNDKIQLYHHTPSGILLDSKAPIVLHGHSHKFMINSSSKNLNLVIPTLSEIGSLMPGALELELNFRKGYIVNSVIKHLYFGEQNIMTLGEFLFDLNGRHTESKPTENIEPYRLKKVLNDEIKNRSIDEI